MDILTISLTNRLSKDKDYQQLVLKMLIMRRLIQHDDNISQKYLACYSRQKDEKDTMEKYVQGVDKCLQSHRKQFDLTTKRFKDVNDSLFQAEDNYRSRNINCFNLVSEGELKGCQEVEKRNYLLRLKTIYEQIPEFALNKQ